jgi:TetR/AcrR family transcriptional regulator, copper-responsive repressor
MVVGERAPMPEKRSQTLARRGRPREYDPVRALLAIRDQFWTMGYAATRVDDLAAAANMHRPSLYAAFGDKASMYLQALRMHGDLVVEAMSAALQLELPISEALYAFYDHCIDSYLHKRRGCFLTGTALIESPTRAAVRNMVQEILLRCESVLETRFAKAQERGELSHESDPKVLAAFASSTLHEIAVWARAGASRNFIEERTRWALYLILGAAPSAGRTASNEYCK